MPKQFLEAGKIVGTHGVRGDLKVQSWCDSPEVLCDFDTLYLDEKTPVTVEKAQVHKNVVLMHLKGIDTVEAAEALRGRVLHLDREDVDLPDDLVFIQDILGFTVHDRRTDREVGKLRDVLTTNPAHDMYELNYFFFVTITAAAASRTPTVARAAEPVTGLSSEPEGV